MDIVFILMVLFFSVVIHEIAHGSVALHLGDPTAKRAGRLTLNPLRHIDPVGTIVVPLFLLIFTFGKGPIFGWAKPVPINPYNFQDKKYGSAKVALAGPASNLALALFFGLILRFFPVLNNFPGFSLMLGYIVYINILLAVFNLLPFPPLDGSHILFTFLPYSAQKTRMFLNQFGNFILLFIIFFFFHWLILLINWIFSLIVGLSFF